MLRQVKLNARYLTNAEIRELDGLMAEGMDSREKLERIARNEQQDFVTALNRRPFNAEDLAGPKDPDAKEISDFVNRDPSGLKVLCEAYQKLGRKQARTFELPEAQWIAAKMGPDTPPVEEIPGWKSHLHKPVGMLKFLDLIDRVSAGPMVWLSAPVANRERVRMGRIALALELYRRKHGTLPATLAALHDHWLTTDPLTGFPFGYKPAKDGTYKLYTDAIPTGNRITL